MGNYLSSQITSHSSLSPTSDAEEERNPSPNTSYISSLLSAYNTSLLLAHHHPTTENFDLHV